MIGSFWSWSGGTKLSIVTTCATSGKAASLVARLRESSIEGAKTSIVLVSVAGSFMRSSKVATDSTFGLRKLIGLKSKRRCASKGVPASATPKVPTTIAIL